MDAGFLKQGKVIVYVEGLLYHNSYVELLTSFMSRVSFFYGSGATFSTN
jgi:hypothetical protein